MWKKIVVIADDLTGAAEMAGLAGGCGLSVDLLTAMPEGPLRTEKEVTVLATDTRSADEREAVDVTRRVAQALPDDVVLFKKTDSALRGHIIAELLTLLEVTGMQRALFIPANPSKGRVIREGIYYINDVPISLTEFAADPEFPVRSSSLRMRFPEADDMGIMMPDISSEDDVRHWVGQADDQTLLAGAADMFSALLQQWAAPTGPTGPTSLTSLTGPTSPTSQTGPTDMPAFPKEDVLVVCGSTQSKPEALPMTTAYMPLALYNGEVSADEWTAELVSLYAAHHALALAVAHHHLTGKEVAVRIRETMAEIVGKIVRCHCPQQLIIEGGATASACCRALGFSHFSEICQLAPGVVRMKADNGMLVTLKPGSYPWK